MVGTTKPASTRKDVLKLSLSASNEPRSGPSIEPSPNAPVFMAEMFAFKRSSLAFGSSALLI